ncbi:MAG: hypothetical protein IT364_11210 [Candidatus Hydrogenedentes bacterium]|nr:hypothetical protein [Candidatus Hydrogenedentota bacterium]
MRIISLPSAILLFCSCCALAQFEGMPRGPLTIVVQDQDGKPVPNAEVHCVNWDYGPRFTELGPEEKGVTDRDGRVHFQDRTFGGAFARVKAGELGGWFRIQGASPEHPEVEIQTGLGHTVTLKAKLPGVLVLADGCLPIGLTDERGMLSAPNFGLGYDPNFAFTKEGYAWTTGSAFRDHSTVEVEMRPGTDIEGVVLGPDGAPVEGADVSTGPYSFKPMKTTAEGRFRLSRCPQSERGASQQLCAHMRANEVLLWAEEQVVLETPLVSGVVLRLAAVQSHSYTVRGRVIRAETGQPVKAKIYQNTSESLSGGKVAASTGRDGHFSIQINRSMGYWYLALPEDPTLRTDGPMLYVGNKEGEWEDKEVEFRVTEGCAIEGRAISEDGTPINDKYVYYLDPDTTFHPPTTDERGRFMLPHLNGAGKAYELYVSDSFGRQGRVTVGPMKQGELRRDVEILLPPQVEPSRLRGTVSDPNGKPMPGMRLQLYFGDPPKPDTTEALTDDRGEYEVKVLYSGPAKVIISSLTPGYILRHRVFDSDEVLLDATKDAEHDFTVSQEPEKQ